MLCTLVKLPLCTVVLIVVTVLSRMAPASGFVRSVRQFNGSLRSSVRPLSRPTFSTLAQHKDRANTLVTNIPNTLHQTPTFALFSSQPSRFDPQNLKRGDKIQVEVVNFGPLGASVDVVAVNTHEPEDVLPAEEPPYATGLILQQEIAYFRDARNNVDVVRGEILPAYVQRVREEDGKIDIGLRLPGGKAKAAQVAEQIMALLDKSTIGSIPVGDKSSSAEIAALFPGVSKASFKRAVSGLYKLGKVTPSPLEVRKVK